MNKKWSKLIIFILLPVILAAGLFIYGLQKRSIKFPDKIHRPVGPIAGEYLKISGKVIKYESNHEGDIDKLLVSSDGKQVWLHFPPHMARLVKSVAHIHEPINALVDQKGPPHRPHPENLFELKSIVNNKLETKLDLARVPAPVPREGFEIEIHGIASLERNENAFTLAGKVIRLPPRMAHELFPLIHEAKIITVKGYMRDSTDGFLSDLGLPVVRPVSVKIDNVIYKIR